MKTAVNDQYVFENSIIEDPVNGFFALQQQIKEYADLNRGDKNAPMPQYRDTIQYLIRFFENDEKLLVLVSEDRKKQQENMEADDREEDAPHPSSSGAFAALYDHSLNMLYSCTVDFKISDEVKEKDYPHKVPVNGRYPYHTVLEAVYAASAFIDAYQRSAINGLTPMYHSDRYPHYGLAVKHKADDMVVVPTSKHLSMLDLIKLRAAPVMMTGVATDIAFADAYFQTSKDFWDHDSNHSRRFDTFNQICLENKLEERCKTDQELRRSFTERDKLAEELRNLQEKGEAITQEWFRGRSKLDTDIKKLKNEIKELEKDEGDHSEEVTARKNAIKEKTDEKVGLSAQHQPSMTENNAARRAIRHRIEALNITINSALEEIREETYREFDRNIKGKILPNLSLDGIEGAHERNIIKMKKALYFELLHEFALPPTKEAMIDAFNFSRRDLGDGPFEIMKPAGEEPDKVVSEISELRILGTNNLLSGLKHIKGIFREQENEANEIDVHYIFDPELAPNFLTTLHNKLSNSFYDNRFKRYAYEIPPVSARTPNLVAEAALSMLDDFGIQRHEVGLPINNEEAKKELAKVAAGKDKKKEVYLDSYLREPNLLGETRGILSGEAVDKTSDFAERLAYKKSSKAGVSVSSDNTEEWVNRSRRTSEGVISR